MLLLSPIWTMESLISSRITQTETTTIARMIAEENGVGLDIEEDLRVG